MINLCPSDFSFSIQNGNRSHFAIILDIPLDILDNVLYNDTARRSIAVSIKNVIIPHLGKKPQLQERLATLTAVGAFCFLSTDSGRLVAANNIPSLTGTERIVQCLLRTLYLMRIVLRKNRVGIGASSPAPTVVAKCQKVKNTTAAMFAVTGWQNE